MKRINSFAFNLLQGRVEDVTCLNKVTRRQIPLGCKTALGGKHTWRLGDTSFFLCFRESRWTKHGRIAGGWGWYKVTNQGPIRVKIEDLIDEENTPEEFFFHLDVFRELNV